MNKYVWLISQLTILLLVITTIILGFYGVFQYFRSGYIEDVTTSFMMVIIAFLLIGVSVLIEVQDKLLDTLPKSRNKLQIRLTDGK